MLLIDCGETVFSEIKRNGLVEDVNNLYVFITHTHSDHIGSLSSLIHYMHYVKNKAIQLLVMGLNSCHFMTMVSVSLLSLVQTMNVWSLMKFYETDDC